MEISAEAIARIRETTADIDTVLSRSLAAKDGGAGAGETGRGAGKYGDLVESAEALKARLAEVERAFWVPPETQGYVKRDDVVAKIDYVLRSLQSTWAAPTQAQTTYLRQAREALESALDELNGLFETEVERFGRRSRELGFEPFPEREPLKLR
jgi:hypothetical protein